MVAIIENADGPLSTRTLTNGAIGSFGDGGDEMTSGVGPPRRERGSRKSFQPSGAENQPLRPPGNEAFARAEKVKI